MCRQLPNAVSAAADLRPGPVYIERSLNSVAEQGMEMEWLTIDRSISILLA